MRLLPVVTLVLGCNRTPVPPPAPPTLPPSATPAVASGDPTPVPDAPAFAFVELFTSEGCSSCPSADVVASELVTRPAVVVLSWHVDHWDHLGWKDPWSRQAASDRQRALAVRLGTGLYTPQIVVDGRVDMVGSHADAVEAAVKGALATPRTTALTVARRPDTPGTFALEATTRGAPTGSRLHVALVEDGLASRPTKGENAGRLLRHDAVVRSALEVDVADGAQSFVLVVPPDAKRARLGAVVWVSRPDGVVVAARRL